MSLWGRVFAAVYDPMLKGSEDNGLGALRAGLVGRASGRTLELGAGTGLNLTHYPDAVTDLTLTEPEAPMAKRLSERLRDSGRPGRILQAEAERLPVEDGSIDTVVATLVFCTVRDLPGALAEVKRVLRPGGRLLFLEHVRHSDPARARKQARFTPVQKVIACGCHLDRATPEAIRTAGFEMQDVATERFPKVPSLLQPLSIGSALRS